jgi:hypothetical protein
MGFFRSSQASASPVGPPLRSCPQADPKQTEVVLALLWLLKASLAAKDKTVEKRAHFSQNHGTSLGAPFKTKSKNTPSSIWVPEDGGL